MKKNERNLVILIGVILLLFLLSRPLAIYGSTNVLMDEVRSSCGMTCPEQYEICVYKWFIPSGYYTINFGAVAEGGQYKSLIGLAPDQQRCLILGYEKDTYMITEYGDTSEYGYIYQCSANPGDVAFCLIADPYFSGYAKYKYVLETYEIADQLTVTMQVDYLVMRPPPPSLTEIDVYEIFNYLFSLIWNALQQLWGWLT